MSQSLIVRRKATMTEKILKKGESLTKRSYWMRRSLPPSLRPPSMTHPAQDARYSPDSKNKRPARRKMKKARRPTIDHTPVKARFSRKHQHEKRVRSRNTDINKTEK